MKFSEWLENRMIRAISDGELGQIIKGDPYTSPYLGRIGLIPKSVDGEKESPFFAYLRHYVNKNKEKSKRNRSWIIDVDIPDDVVKGEYPDSVKFLDPKHVKGIRRSQEDPDQEKVRDAEKFISTFRRFFPSIQ